MGLVEDDPPNNDASIDSKELQWNECNLLSRKAGPRKIAVLTDSTNSSSFTICWDCYQTSISRTPLSAFFLTQHLPKTRSASCKFAEFWVRFAWLHVLEGKGDIDTLLLGAGLIKAPERRCPNANLSKDSETKSPSNRLWYTISDLDTGDLLKQWTICGDCYSQIVKMCDPIIETAFKKVSESPARATCDLVPKVSSTRSWMCLEQLLRCERITQETGEIDMRPLAEFIKRFAGVPACPRDVPTTTPRKFYHIPGGSEYAICQDCYLTVIEPEAKEGVSLAEDVMLSARPTPRMTCQLYSERMRMVWADAVATSDKAFLLQKIGTKERNRQVQTARLNQRLVQLQGQHDMLNSQSMFERQYAVNEWCGNSSAYAAASASNAISGGSYTVLPVLKPVDLSRSQDSSNKAMAALQEKSRVYTELENLEKEWKRYWE